MIMHIHRLLNGALPNRHGTRSSLTMFALLSNI